MGRPPEAEGKPPTTFLPPSALGQSCGRFAHVSGPGSSPKLSEGPSRPLSCPQCSTCSSRGSHLHLQGSGARYEEQKRQQTPPRPALCPGPRGSDSSPAASGCCHRLVCSWRAAEAPGPVGYGVARWEPQGGRRAEAEGCADRPLRTCPRGHATPSSADPEASSRKNYKHKIKVLYREYLDKKL